MKLCCTLCPTDESCVKAVLALMITDNCCHCRQAVCSYAWLSADADVVSQLCFTLLLCTSNTRDGFDNSETDASSKFCMQDIPCSIRVGLDNKSGILASLLLLLAAANYNSAHKAPCSVYFA